MKKEDINLKCINTIRVLSCEMIEKANSGHPGIALGAAPIIYSLYSSVLNVNPKNPAHILRDRFVLSAGHGSALLYSTLHLFGYNYSLNDLKNFRQLNSVTPGHPEYDIARGVEATTGPLGQGVANAVGMAIAERHLASKFNKPDATLIDNYTYALVGDGCLMEGVSNEALSLAGTLKLNKLIVFYDFNKITIDGRIDNTFKQNTKTVFSGYGFNVLEVADGNDYKGITKAVEQAKKSLKPTLIIVNTLIGYGSLVENTHKAHGAPLGSEGLEFVKQRLDINTKPFEVSAEVGEYFNKLQQRFSVVEEEWKNRISGYKNKYPQLYKEFETLLTEDFSGVEKVISHLKVEKEKVSTRDLGGLVLNELANYYDNLVGGAADLVSSTKTVIKNSGVFSPQDPSGRNIMFGVREFAMGAISNGISLYGGLVPFAGTFFVFSDYMRAAIRLSALSHIKVLYIFTHDSIGVGEDGPTHQSVEQLASFRAMPNVVVFRPCNLDEVKASYIFALKHNGPTLIILTRQNILNFETLKTANNLSYKNYEDDVLKGAYVVAKEKGTIDAIILATGSEVQIALEAKRNLEEKGLNVRVVSVSSCELFDKQTQTYKNKILPPQVTARVAVEAGSNLGWHKYVGLNGLVLGINEFGKSGKFEDIYEFFNITSKNLTQMVLNLVNKK